MQEFSAQSALSVLHAALQFATALASEVLMKAFGIFLNGNNVCTAGVGNLGVLTAVLTWVRREGQNTESRSPGSSIEEELTLDVGGLVSPSREHIDWAQIRLNPGDEISIRILDVESASPPLSRKTEDPAEDIKRQQEYVERMAKQFGWTILK